MDKSIEIKDGTLAFVIEGIQNPSTNFSNESIAIKKRSVEFKQQEINKKRGLPTNVSIINDIDMQVIEDDNNTRMEIENEEIIDTLARKDVQHKKIQKRRGRPTKELSNNKDMKMKMNAGDNITRIDIEDYETIASLTKKKRRMTKEKIVKQRSQNIKKEK